MAAINDTFEIALVHTGPGGQIVIVTHHFRMMSGVPVPPVGQSLIDNWQALQATWLAVLGPNFTLQRIRARHVCGSIPLDATVEEAVNLLGTRGTAGAGVGAWLAAVCRERTQLAGRSRRGRFFIPVSGESDFTVDQLDAVFTTPAQAYVTALAARFLSGGASAADWRLVVHSRVLAQPGVQCQNSSTLIDNLALQSALTTQRSRRPRPA